MFNLRIEDIVTGKMTEWKCEWNWNANQEKQTLYTAALVELIALEGNFSTLTVFIYSVNKDTIPIYFYSLP